MGYGPKEEMDAQSVELLPLGLDAIVNKYFCLHAKVGCSDASIRRNMAVMDVKKKSVAVVIASVIYYPSTRKINSFLDMCGKSRTTDIGNNFF